ncbi:MAG: S8/S53 family peptidase, partial [Candidatus Melainabacteria bacterium]|nr:S8/S53 family peptidase [Candidatus Melainabacteria bacterium]
MRNSYLAIVAMFLLLAFLALCAAGICSGVWSLYKQINLKTFAQAHTLTAVTPSPSGKTQLLRRMDANYRMEIVVGLCLRNGVELDALIKRQADPGSPYFRRYLSPQEFVARFSPSQADHDLVVEYLTSNGLVVSQSAPNRLIVVAEGTVLQIERSFGVNINEYSQDGKVYLSNDRESSVPSTLAPIVESVIGLNTFAEYKSPMRSLTPQVRPMRPGGLSPQQIATAYNFPNQNNGNNPSGTRYSGKGRTVAIATCFSYKESDVEGYWKQYGITRAGMVTNILIGGSTTKPDKETTLDLQQLGAQAPGANVLMYISTTASIKNLTVVYNKIVTDNKADVVSTSWGLCERQTHPNEVKTQHNIFKQAASQGIAIFAASGNAGAYDCDEDSKKSVDFPPSDPYVTAVGGTTLSLGLWNKRKAEEAWMGAGAGESILWPQPSWQKGPGVPSNQKRNISDVALVASPLTPGYAVYLDGVWEVSGGTSFAAPNWAALWVLLVEASGKRLGPPNEIIYRIGQLPEYKQVFYDITSGSNSNWRGPGYNAGPGWDYP